MKKLLSVLLVLLLVVISGCQTTEEVALDKNLVCLPAEELVELEPDEGLEEVIPGLTDIVELPVVEEEPVVEEVVEEPVVEDVVEEKEYAAVKTFSEGDLVVLDPQATDPDNDQVTFTFSSPLDGEGEWQTEKGDAGEYEVSVVASDGIDSVTKYVLLVIETSNSAPVLLVNDVSFNEGDLVKLDVDVSDADGDSVSVVYSIPLDEDGEWQTGYDDSGKYKISVDATDGINSVTETITLTINNVNRAPVLEPIEHIAVLEGEKVEVDVEVEDPDSDDLTFTYTEPLDNEGEWQTEVGDAGSYVSTVSVSDGESLVEKAVSIIVNKLNNAPTLSVEGVVVQETDLVKLDPEVFDSDGDDIVVTYSGVLSDGEWQTGYDDAGEYSVTVTATDGTETVSVDVVVVVEDVNRPPEFVI